MEKNTPKITVIIPIYNVENYLHETLFSAVSQTLKDIEIICINDCSTDKSKEILKKFCDTDERIRYIEHSSNMGVGFSRKEGVLAATGEFIMFLDGDDRLDINACKKCYHEMKKEPVDILQFGTVIVPAGNVDRDEVQAVQPFFSPHLECLRGTAGGYLDDICFAQEKFGFSLWNKAYRRDILRKAVEYYEDERFDIAEDLYLFFLIAFFSGSYRGIETNCYYYRLGAGITGGKRTITDRRFRDKARQGKILSHIEQFAERFDPSGNTENAIEAIRDRFISDVIYNWLYCGEALDKRLAMNRILENFDQALILSKLLGYYYSDDKLKKKIIDGCAGIQIDPRCQGRVKTIGTFYFRIGNGGVERTVAKLVSIWTASGYRVVLFTDEVPSPTDYTYPDSVIRIIMPKIENGSEKEIKERILYLQDMLFRYHVDVMVYHAWFWKYLAVDLAAAKAMGVPFIVHTHSFFGHGLKSPVAEDAATSLLINRLYRLCDAVVTLTETDRSWWSVVHGRVYKTINPLPFEIGPIEVGKLNGPNILWVGRISWEKQPLDALKILKEIVDSGIEAKMQFLGKSDNKDYEREFLNTIEDLGLSQYVELLGYHTDVGEYYKNASVYLCTSEYEGFLMTLAESKAYGIPAVLYDLPNLDMVQDGRGMCIVEPGDIRGAAESIIALLDDEQKRKELGKDARKSIEDMYSFDIAALWDQVFYDVISDRVNSETVPGHTPLNTAIQMMLDFSEKGINAREHERTWWMQQAAGKASVQESEYMTRISNRDYVLRMYQNGEIGFRYIVKYAIAWLKYKLTGKK